MDDKEFSEMPTKEALLGIASNLKEQSDEWHDARMPLEWLIKATDKDILEYMSHSAWVQDRSNGWNDRELAQFLRGYLRGEHTFLGNAASSTRAYAHVIKEVAKAIKPEQAEAYQAGRKAGLGEALEIANAFESGPGSSFSDLLDDYHALRYNLEKKIKEAPAV